MRSKLTLVVVTLALTACGGSSSETATTSHEGAGGGETGGGETTATAETRAATDIPALPAGISGPPSAWDSMTGEQKGHWMADHVVPTMAPLFAGYDSTRFGDVDCGTCHGPNAREEHFHMPSASLPKLPTPMSPEWQRMMTEHPRAVAFMSQDVEHGMAALIGEAPYDPQTNQGFGCFNCHMQREAGSTN